MALQRRGDRGEVRRGLDHPVERHGGADLVAALGGELHDEAAAHAEADRADGRPLHPVQTEEVVDRSTEIAGGVGLRQLAHEPAGLLRVVGRGAAVEIGCQRDEPLGGQPVGDVGDVVGQTPPLLDGDDPGPGAGGRACQVAVRVVAVGRELDVLVRVVSHTRGP